MASLPRCAARLALHRPRPLGQTTYVMQYVLSFNGCKTCVRSGTHEGAQKTGFRETSGLDLVRLPSNSLITQFSVLLIVFFVSIYFTAIHPNSNDWKFPSSISYPRSITGSSGKLLGAT